MSSKEVEYTMFVDTAEQQPWAFADTLSVGPIGRETRYQITQVKKPLRITPKDGPKRSVDYGLSLLGGQDWDPHRSILVERKKTFGELADNMIGPDRKRFIEELEWMGRVGVRAYLALEFSYCSVGQSKVYGPMISPHSRYEILQECLEITSRNNIRVLWLPSRPHGPALLLRTLIADAVCWLS